MRPILPEDGFEASPLDRERWDSSVARWQQAESHFATEPAEAVRQAERLFVDLTGQRGDSPSSTVKVLTRLRRPSLEESRMTFTDGGDVLAAIPDLVQGVSESYRRVRHARAAARGITAARNHRDANLADLQEAMQLYRGMFERILTLKREDLDSFMGQAQTAAVAESSPAGRLDDAAAAEARDRVIARKIVEESMLVNEQAEARADRWRIVRWGVLGLVGNLAFGLVILLVIIWVLSQQ